MSAAQSRVVADRYRLVEPLGQGGMGRVWMARDELLHRDVAIKELVPPTGLTGEERQEMRERAMREARAIARLSHPNVVRIFDIMRTDGDPWIVMEYVRSRSLQDVLAQDGPLSPRRAAEVGLGMLAALRAAHIAGVVHRDVKPGNVLLGDDGRVVLTDFGLATIPGDPVVTRTGLVLGSPAYISPERAGDGTAGPEADMWSLGATLYAAVEGKSPYARPSAIATLTALATEPPPAARRAGQLKPVLNGLLRKDPAARIGAAETERLLLRAAGRRPRPGGSLMSGLRRPNGSRLPATRPAPVVAGVASVPPPRRAEPAGSPNPAPVEPEPVAVAAPAVADKPAAEPDQPAAQPAAQPGQPADQPAQPAAEPGQPAQPADQPGQPAAEPGQPGQPAAQPAAQPGQPATQPAQPDAMITEVEPEAPPAPGREPAAPPGRAAGRAAAVPVEPDEPDTVRRSALDRVRELPTRVLAGVAGAVALVVLLTAVLVTRGDEPAARPDPRGAGPTASAEAGPPAPTAPKPTAGPTRRADPAPPPVTAAPEPDTGSAASLPEGWYLYKDRTGFRVAVRRDWRISREATIVYFREQTGQRRVLGIDQTDNPKPDPVADWRRQEAQRAHTKPNYRRVKIVAVDYFDKAADWEYTYDGRSSRLHAINRGFVTGPDQAHAILWITPDSRWAENLDDFALIARSFRPIP